MAGLLDDPYIGNPNFQRQGRRELMAEAIHAYRTNPNYIKTVAPKTAAAIRDASRGVPNLNKVIQFNSVGSAGIAGGLLADDKEE